MTDKLEHVAPDRRVAVFGAGGWGKNHVRTFFDLGALAVVCDPRAEQRAMVEKLYPTVAVCGDPQEALARSDYQGVVVATPAATHAELSLAALEAGKDLLVEKPLALASADAELVVKEADRLGAVLMVGHLLEHHPAVQTLRRIVADRQLGKLLWASSSRLSLGKVRSVENVLWSFAPHDIAMLVGLAGAPPESVRCHGAAYLRPGIEDVVFLGMSFAGGFEAEVRVSWLHPTKEQRLVVVGDRAMAVFDDVRPASEKLSVTAYEMEADAVSAIQATDSRSLDIGQTLPLTAQAQHFLDRIADRARPTTDGVSGLQVLRVLEAGQRSLAASGSPVPLEDR